MQRLLTVLLAFLGMTGALAIDAYLPSMPAIGVEFGVGPVAVQQTLSVFLFTFALMMLFYGTLSDSFGRRPVILGALALYTLSSIGAAFAPSFGWLLVFRALQGLSAGAGSVIGQAIVQDRFAGPQAQKIMSHIMMVFGLAPAIAPIIGGWVHVHFGWRATFYLLALFGIVMIALVLRLLPESLPPEKRQPFHPATIGRNYLMVLRHPQFVMLSLAVGLAFGGLALYIGSAANFVMDILGLPETAFAWMFIPLIGGMVIGSAWGGKRAAKSPRRLLWIGYAVMAAGSVLNIGYNALFPATVPWAVLPLAVFTFGLAVAMPGIQVTAMGLFPHNRGLAASMVGFIQMMSFALVSGLVAPQLFGSALKLAAGAGIGVVLSFLLWRLSLRFAKPAA
ncbi:multidrug effflux MFS transporter [Massilia yuzhufengensis]|uniref:Bcr/CflA family efflux transporter n=1 Tax=Massilia yuzhufengensis TaxID=1164594 RepID=A0A1I1J434_9BURK|nr:multidrug effflux MFS transporter [Massilia yuzhufengensis]SFC43206.1 MFS transporter, DHA1 family, bicyclomycin/chloramphenicol resistance protein [Massilia yuzhufengensis]